MSSNLGSSPRASVQRAEQTQTLNIHHSLSDKARFFENSLPLVADSGNGDLKRALLWFAKTRQIAGKVR